MAGDDLPLRHHHEPLPKTAAAVLSRVKQVLGLSSVEELRISLEGIEVSRRVPEGAPVLPGPEEALDPEFVISNLTLEESSTPGQHPYLRLAEGMASLTAKGLAPILLVAPAGGLLGALFGLPESAGDVGHFMGVPVHYTTDGTYSEKVVIIGSSSRFLEDASMGALIDIGV